MTLILLLGHNPFTYRRLTQSREHARRSHPHINPQYCGTATAVPVSHTHTAAVAVSDSGRVEQTRIHRYLLYYDAVLHYERHAAIMTLQ